ncbi:hybrid sensor histidine kinase/response regulator [Anaeromyxobacter diazotrophicus]|uniref:histidine kinase n=1 Tax=Anaeromyxobacter diazotrophicus TaxID=2590199 RepID=A0A7I9VQ86_9BACT|nr:PAS domain S-box protein [Anaeromyxobacter diazotrophicus]GEJ58408.1 hypothetical protein AMYX_31490 [Anaeromyxobacter diazotrophicus]
MSIGDFAAKTAGRELATSADAQGLVGAVLDTVASLVVVLDREGRIVRFNRACELATGFTAAEVVGRSVFELLVPADELGDVRPVFERLERGEFPSRHQNRWRTKDGGARLFDWANTCVLDERGQVELVIGTATDVTERDRAERALRDSEERARRRSAELEAVLDAVPAAVFITRDREARSMEGNGFCLELLRLPPGRNLSASAPGGERPRGFRAMRGGQDLPPEQLPVQIAAATGSEVRQCEYDLVFSDGEVRHMLGNATPLREPDGRLRGAVGAFLDITELKRSEQALRGSEARLRALADSMPQLAWTARPDGYIDWYNRRWYAYTGTTPERMEGWGWQEVHDPASLPAVLRRWRESVATGSPFEMEFPLRGADGRFRRFLTRVYPLRDEGGAVVQWFGTNTDVTELVEAQEALREADRRKDDFLGMLSHELRNPLAPIRNSIYILRHAEASSEQAARAQRVIERQAEHLTRLVDDLLDVTRIARGKTELRRSRFDLLDVVLRAADDFRAMLDERGVALRVELPSAGLPVDADETRLTQVVGNLLHNAAKFTRRGDQVTLAVRAAGGEAEIAVRDTGVGIDAALLPNVFQPFVQGARTLARTEGGLGLGLALVKGLVDLHGGSVRVESAGEGQGAEFTVRLPLAVPGAARPEPRAGAGPGGARRRVLVVDDNADAADSLAELTRMLGHEVAVVYDGPSAVARARAEPFDVILCDLGLPGMSGYEVAKAIRAGGAPGLRMVALSGYAQPEDRRAALDAGFERHLAKPACPDDIARVLG